MEARTVFKDAVFIGKSHSLPLNSRQDGGHFVLDKMEQVHDISNLTRQEAIDFIRTRAAVGRTMYDVLGIELMKLRRPRELECRSAWWADDAPALMRPRSQ
jgi:hypothetical protein